MLLCGGVCMCLHWMFVSVATFAYGKAVPFVKIWAISRVLLKCDKVLRSVSGWELTPKSGISWMEKEILLTARHPRAGRVWRVVIVIICQEHPG
ncbi:MAG TPA: hypothetical protein DCE42_22440 [Myxococcales bacterium]|nr:hypothetical protein [Myxococcales bacterium]